MFIWNSILDKTENISVASHSEAPSHPSGSDEDPAQWWHKSHAALSAICPKQNFQKLPNEWLDTYCDTILILLAVGGECTQSHSEATNGSERRNTAAAQAWGNIHPPPADWWLLFTASDKIYLNIMTGPEPPATDFLYILHSKDNIIQQLDFMINAIFSSIQAFFCQF